MSVLIRKSRTVILPPTVVPAGEWTDVLPEFVVPVHAPHFVTFRMARVVADAMNNPALFFATPIHCDFTTDAGPSNRMPFGRHSYESTVAASVAPRVTAEAAGIGDSVIELVDATGLVVGHHVLIADGVTDPLVRPQFNQVIGIAGNFIHLAAPLVDTVAVGDSVAVVTDPFASELLMTNTAYRFRASNPSNRNIIVAIDVTARLH